MSLGVSIAGVTYASYKFVPSFSVDGLGFCFGLILPLSSLLKNFKGTNPSKTTIDLLDKMKEEPLLKLAEILDQKRPFKVFFRKMFSLETAIVATASVILVEAGPSAQPFRVWACGVAGAYVANSLGSAVLEESSNVSLALNVMHALGKKKKENEFSARFADEITKRNLLAKPPIAQPVAI